jgi:hypothetical protein
MNDTRVDIGDEEPNEEFLSQVSTFEALMIQALMNQLTDIVENQNRRTRISYANQLIQVQTLQSLAQTALMLTDAETIFLHGGKLQGFINRAVLEHTLGVKIPNERPASKPNTDDESTDSDEEPGTPSEQS